MHRRYDNVIIGNHQEIFCKTTAVEISSQENILDEVLFLGRYTGTRPLAFSLEFPPYFQEHLLRTSFI